MTKTTTSSKQYDVVVIGEINVDIILKGNVVPAFGQVEQILDAADVTLGSSAVIFACGAAHLGLKTAFIGKVGADIFGAFMIEEMIKRGIDTSGVTADPLIKTGFSVILTTHRDRAILTYPGSIPELKFEDIDFQLVGKCRHLHLSGFFLLDQLRPNVYFLLKKAKDLGLTVSLDTNFDPKEQWDSGLLDCLPLIDVFLPNEREALEITRETTLEEAIGKLAKTIPLIAIKKGEEGALVFEKGKLIAKQAALPVDFVDAVGAGDSFDSGFIYGYLNEWPPERSLQLAVICGSLSTRAAGGTSGQPTLREALMFMGKEGSLE